MADFVRQAWNIIEPETELKWNWHHDLICEHLEAVTAGAIRDLVINVPPRHTKSRIISVMWPAWVWIKQPSLQWLCASYADDLALRDSVFCRNIIQSGWYRTHFGKSFVLTTDQNVKSRYVNDHGGHRITTSVGGAATGEGGDIILCDDPHNLKEANSKAKRKAVINWWDQVMTSRRNDPKTGRRVIVMQRCHFKDLTGHVMDKRPCSFKHLNIDSDGLKKTEYSYPVSGKVKTRKKGELLWGIRFDKKELASIKVDVGGYGYAAQYNGNPVPEGGGIFKRKWWQYYKKEAKPKARRTIHSWDSSFKEGEENSPSTCIVIDECAHGFYITDVWRDQVEYPELKRMAKGLFYRDAPAAVLVEDKASGQSLIQELRRTTRMPVIAVKVEGDKVVRAHACSPIVESMRVYLPEDAPWLADFLEEMTSFPKSDFKDQVDALGQALLWLDRAGGSKAPKVKMHDPANVAGSKARRLRRKYQRR